MAKGKSTPSNPAVPKSAIGRDMYSGWGGEVVHERIPSGVKLRIMPDDDMILRYIGKKDISDKVKDASPEKPALIFAFFDGKQNVNISGSYAFREVQFEAGNYYYIHHAGEIEGELNPLKDFHILKLGVSGEIIQVPERVDPSKKFTLCDENIEAVNFKRLNYSLRTS